jgi:large subunit ribosomal protein L25
MDLSVQTREITGKKVRMLRRLGLVPAELYGHGLKNQHLSVPAKEFAKVFKEAGANTVLTLVAENGKHSAIIHDVQKDYLSGDIVHIDFHEVRMDEKITAKIPLEFVGISAVVKEKGGILNKSITELEVEALPNDLPHRLTVDLALLDELNKTIYVRDLAIPKGVTVLIDVETAIATATPPMAEEVVETPVDVTAVKVETEEKKAERAAGKEDKEEGK